MSVCPPNKAEELKKTAVVRQRFGKDVLATKHTSNNRRIVGRGIFYAVVVVSDTQHVVQGKWAITSSENSLFNVDVTF